MTEVDRFELELYALGELTDPDRVRAVEAAIAGPLADTWAELQAAQASWSPPPLPLPESDEVEARPTAGSAIPTRSGWGTLALAAAAVLAVVAALTLRSAGEPEPAVRAMGSLPVDAYAEGAALGALSAGDVLGVQTTLPQGGVVAVGLVQPGHGAQLLWVSEPAEAGVEVTIPAGLELDDYSGEEWLVLSLHPAAPTEEAWTVYARDFVQHRSTDVPARAILLRGARR